MTSVPPPGPTAASVPPPVPPMPSAPAVSGDWQPLPARGAWLAALGGAMLALPFGGASIPLATLWPVVSPWIAVPAVALAGAALGAWVAVRRHRRTFWKLDGHGFALRRGHWWRVETRVPISRVQHLDLKHGPLERHARLATLVIHTAGTRLATVSASGLDAGDAQRLRDRLARQLDHDDAL